MQPLVNNRFLCVSLHSLQPYYTIVLTNPSDTDQYIWFKWYPSLAQSLTLPWYNAHKKKLVKYHNTQEDLLQGRGFLPISIESFGRFHSSIKPLIGAIGEKAAAISGVSSSILINYWTNRISACLQIHLARMMLARVYRILNSTVTLFSATSNHTKIFLQLRIFDTHV